jgi:hypothetical protein
MQLNTEYFACKYNKWWALQAESKYTQVHTENHWNCMIIVDHRITTELITYVLGHRFIPCGPLSPHAHCIFAQPTNSNVLAELENCYLWTWQKIQHTCDNKGPHFCINMDYHRGIILLFTITFQTVSSIIWYSQTVNKQLIIGVASQFPWWVKSSAVSLLDTEE